MPELFGTDGIRGRPFAPPLDEPTVRRLGAALALELTGHEDPPHLLLAGDTRRSTEILAGWLAEAFQAGGGRVTWGGVLPTPAVSHLLAAGGFTAGVVVSASHNPAHDNGIKVLAATGEKLEEAAEERLESLHAAVRPGSGPPLPERDHTLSLRYLHRLASIFSTSQPLAGLTLVVDAANGAASALAGPLLTRLGANVTVICDRPDGDNINDSCGATAPGRLVETVRTRGADGGLALDGDADRSLVVDGDGRVLDGDDLLLAWGRALHRRGSLPGARVVATVMSNFGLERALARDGIALERSAVGDRNVWLAMREHGAALGGEQSGHVICSHHAVTGDGLLTGTQVLAIAATTGKPVASLSDLERLPQVLLNVPVQRKPPFAEVPVLRSSLAHTEAVLAGRGRVLLRYSGTEPLARVMVEGEDAAEIAGLAHELADSLRAALG